MTKKGTYQTEEDSKLFAKISLLVEKVSKVIEVLEKGDYKNPPHQNK